MLRALQERWRAWRRVPRRRRVAIAAGAVAVVWLGTGLYAVGSDERAVVLRFGRLAGVTGPGLHYTLPLPIDRVHRVATTQVRRIQVGFTSKGELWREARRSDLLTGDENILKLEIVVQYRAADPVAFLFGTDEPGWLVERSVESAMAAIVSTLPVDDVLTTAKAEVEIRAVEDAQARLDAYGAGIRLLGGNLQTVSPPEPVIDAFNDVVRAKKDSERQVENARMYENQILPSSRGEADALIARARGEANMRVDRARGEAERFGRLQAEYRRDPDLTRRRLYLETMDRLLAKAELILADDGSKLTIVDGEIRKNGAGGGSGGAIGGTGGAGGGGGGGTGTFP